MSTTANFPSRRILERSFGASLEVGVDTNTTIVCITALVAIVAIVTIVLALGGKVDLKLKIPRKQITAHAESLNGVSHLTKMPQGGRRSLQK